MKLHSVILRTLYSCTHSRMYFSYLKSIYTKSLRRLGFQKVVDFLDVLGDMGIMDSVTSSSLPHNLPDISVPLRVLHNVLTAQRQGQGS